MIKKKHQGDPNEHSTDSCDENQNNVVECLHINKSIDLQKLKKSLIKSGFLKDCEDCKKVPENTQDDEMELEFDLSLWMCLKCGNQACGRGKNKHAIKHYETPHSDKHSLCVNTTIWNVWCYECDEEVNITCKRKLLEAVEYLRKHWEAANNKVNRPNVENCLEIIPLPEPQSLSNNLIPKSTILPRARGLTNLGNTCFFNSVMQCLGQTPYLVELLCEGEEPGQHVFLPGGKLNPADKESSDLEPIEEIYEKFENIANEKRAPGSKIRFKKFPRELGKWKALTNVLADTLRELNSGRAEVYTPRLLLSRLTHRMPQFGGGDQHDAHELLRHLLDAAREEDIKRYQAFILESKGFKRDVDPATVSEEEKQMVKFYAQQAESLLPTEQIFRGVLVSTLQCQECNHTSHRDEYFLDLSLPVVEKQLPPRRKADEIEEKPSKHQIKKEKRAERKKNKTHKYHKFPLNGPLTNLGDPNSSQDNGRMEKSESESDADVEDNAEDSTSMSNQTMDDTTIKGTESGYNSDKVYNNSSPDSNDRGMSPVTHVDDSGIPSPSTGVMNLSPSGVNKLFPSSLPSSPSSIGTNYADMGSPICGHNSPIEEDKPEDMERPESRLSFNNNNNNNNNNNRGGDLKADLEKLMLNDGDSNKINYLCNDNNPNTSKYERGLSNEDEKMEEDEEPQEDPNMYTTTFSPRYQCKEGECSLQSCLNQFTTWEFLNGCNKVSCDSCTKRLGPPEQKMNATKQLLIYNPPAVLILHLKRFQVFRFRAAKVSKHVNFPPVLDIAPFVSKRSKSLSTFEEGQTKILYSLYGVVEHSGSTNGGHYVAYVKVRPQLDKNSYRWNFLPRNHTRKIERIDPSSDPEVPSGKWYYISDSYVSEVSEEKVLNTQAYLLFYERIL